MGSEMCIRDSYKPINEISFIPLDSNKEMSINEILENHPKGKEYSYIFKDKKGEQIR